MKKAWFSTYGEEKKIWIFIFFDLFSVFFKKNTEKVSFFEYNIMKEPISRELCEKLAGEELEAEIAKELLPGSQLVSSETFVEIIDEETVSVRKVMEFTENIGTENYIEAAIWQSWAVMTVWAVRPVARVWEIRWCWIRMMCGGWREGLGFHLRR